MSDPVDTVRATARDLAARYGDLLAGSSAAPQEDVVRALERARTACTPVEVARHQATQMTFDLSGR